MILAAGLGKRMRPLTLTTPKPLLLVNNKPLIVHHIERLAEAGIKDIIINISWLGKMIQTALGDGNQWHVTIHYSKEPAPLESGGGICQALPLLGSEPFIVMNSDIYTNFPIKTLHISHCSKLAHLIMVDNPTFRPEGDFILTDDDTLQPNNTTYTHNIAYANKALTFSGMSIISPKLFHNIQPAAFPLAPLLSQAMLTRQVTGIYYPGIWFDVGTPQRLQHVNHLLQPQPQ